MIFQVIHTWSMATSRCISRPRPRGGNSWTCRSITPSTWWTTPSTKATTRARFPERAQRLAVARLSGSLAGQRHYAMLDTDVLELPGIGCIDVLVEQGAASHERGPVAEHASHLAQIGHRDVEHLAEIHVLGVDNASGRMA